MKDLIESLARLRNSLEELKRSVQALNLVLKKPNLRVVKK